MSEHNFSTEQLRDLLLSNGVKPSVQRLSVLRFIMEKKEHPSVDDIYKELSNEIPTLSRTTVYNTLKHLTEKGIINTLSIDEVQSKYDFIEETHAHFLCKNCGKIYDIALDPQLLNSMVTDGHQVLNTQIYFKGICNNCKH